MRVVLALVFMVLGSGVAFAGMQGCYDGKVRTANGADVSTAAGQEFKIYPGQGPHTATWMPLDRLSICRDKANAYRLTCKIACNVDPLRGRFRVQNRPF